MDTRRSFYLASGSDDFAELTPDGGWADYTDISYVMPANDNVRTKDSLSARVGTLLRRLIALHGPDERALRRVWRRLFLQDGYPSDRP